MRTRPRNTGANGSHVPEYMEDWDLYFLSFAETAARKSKDPRCRVGAVIVSPGKLVVATGFNGLVRHIPDDVALLADIEEKLRMICHAELNAILNAARLGAAVAGCSIYVTKFPCLACCNAIVQSGIQRLYTHDHRYWNDDPADPDHSRKKYILRQAGVHVEASNHPDFVPAHLIELRSAAHSKKASGQAKASKRVIKKVDAPPQRSLFR